MDVLSVEGGICAEIMQSAGRKITHRDAIAKLDLLAHPIGTAIESLDQLMQRQVLQIHHKTPSTHRTKTARAIQTHAVEMQNVQFSEAARSAVVLPLFKAILLYHVISDVKEQLNVQDIKCAMLEIILVWTLALFMILDVGLMLSVEFQIMFQIVSVLLDMKGTLLIDALQKTAQLIQSPQKSLKLPLNHNLSQFRAIHCHVDQMQFVLLNEIVEQLLPPVPVSPVTMETPS